MELRTLRYVLAIADAGSVMAAADRLHLTQPSLSRQIRRLERELRFEIFTRGAGALRPSPAGRRFLPLARELVEHAEATRRAAGAIASGSLRDIVIAATPTTLTDVIAPFIATLAVQDPWPVVRAVPSDEVHAALGRGCDLSVGPHPVPAGLSGLVVAHLPVLAQVPPGHRWAGRTTVSLGELVTEPLLVQTRGAHSRQFLESALAADELAVPDLHELDSGEVAMALAASGRGVAVVTDDPRYGLLPLRIEGSGGSVVFSLHAAWPTGHHASSEVATLALRLREF